MEYCELVNEWIRECERDDWRAEDRILEYLESHPETICYCESCGAPLVSKRAAKALKLGGSSNFTAMDVDGSPYCEECHAELDCDDFGGAMDDMGEDYYGAGCGNYEFDW